LMFLPSPATLNLIPKFATRKYTADRVVHREAPGE
jgi:hypothetical protein